MKKFLFFVAMYVLSVTLNAQNVNGAYLLTEGMFGNSSGKLFWLATPASELEQKEGLEFGETSTFATIYGDKLFVTSKQVGNYGGGFLTIFDAKTLTGVASFSTLIDDGHNYDGRMFYGVDETKGYLCTSNGIFVIDIENNVIVKFIEGTECGYGVGEAIDGGWYQYDTYWNQVGAVVRVGNHVFVSQQNRGILIIDADTDKIVHLIDSELYGGSFGDLIQAKDGSLWTTVCSKENYSYDHTPASNKLVKIDPYSYSVEILEMNNKISVSWSTYRTPMMQVCKDSNRILWKGVSYFDWMLYEQVGLPQICYYDIDTQTEGVFVDFSKIDSNYSIYSGFSVDPQTGNVYVPVASSGSYGPWYLYIFDSKGELISKKDIPIGDYDDYPAMVFFTDDYAAEFNMEDEYILKLNEERIFTIADIVTDKDSNDAGIIVEVSNVEDEGVVNAEVVDGKLHVTCVGMGVSKITLKANSNGKISTTTFNVVEEVMSSVDDLYRDSNSDKIEYYNLQGVKVDNPKQGLFIKKQGGKASKVVL